MAVDWSTDEPDFTPPQIEVVDIATLEQAIEWGDGWVEAHKLERRARLREIHALHERIFWLEQDVFLRDCQLALLRAQMRLEAQEREANQLEQIPA